MIVTHYDDEKLTILIKTTFWDSVVQYFSLIFWGVLFVFVSSIIFWMAKIMDFFIAFAIVFIVFYSVILIKLFFKNGLKSPLTPTLLKVDKKEFIIELGYSADKITRKLDVGKFLYISINDQFIARSPFCCVELVGKKNRFVIRRSSYKNCTREAIDRNIEEMKLWSQPIAQWLELEIKKEIW